MVATCVLAAVSVARAEDPVPPDAGPTVDAWFAVRGWLDAYDLPAPDGPEASVPLGDASGVCLIVRRSGRVVAGGISTTGDDRGDRMVRQAAGAAFGQLHGVIMDDLPESLRLEVARSLTLEVEVAGPLQPLLVRRLDRVGRSLEPGLDGVALRLDRELALEFPARLRAWNRAGQLDTLVPALASGLGIRQLDGLLDRRDVQLYRFRTLHLAQTELGRPPIETWRGQSVVPDGAITMDAITELTDDLADHVIRVLPYRSPEGQRLPRLGMMGDYDPVADTFSPLVAAPREQALLAFALARYARRPDAAHRREALRVATETVRSLAVHELIETDPLDDPVACAAIVHAVLETPRLAMDPGVRRLFAEARARVETALAPGAPFVLSGHDRALAAAALARLLADGTPKPDAAAVRRAIDEAWASVPEPLQIGLLPWIGWAELDHARATGEPLRGVARLELIRSVLDHSRVGREGAPDLAGGFALVGPGGSVRPTAQTVRPAAFLATMLRTPELTPPDQAAGALGRHLLTVRFLAQLSVRPECLWSTRNPDQALGGIRAATWDRTQPAAAQALALLALVETLTSLRQDG